MISWAVFALAVVATITALVAIAAAGELLNSVRELESHVGYSDSLIPLAEDAKRLKGRTPSSFGLPAQADAAKVILVVAPTCLSCQRLLERLGGTVPSELTVLVAGRRSETLEWLRGLSLSPDDVIIDDEDLVMNRLGLSASPVALVARASTVVAVYAVTSYRSLSRLLADTSERGQVILRGEP